MIRAHTTVVWNATRVTQKVTKSDVVCVGDVREPLHQPIVEAELSRVGQLEDHYRGEDLRDAIRKERWLPVRSRDPECLRLDAGILDDGRAGNATTIHRRSKHLGISQLLNSSGRISASAQTMNTLLGAERPEARRDQGPSAFTDTYRLPP